MSTHAFLFGRTAGVSGQRRWSPAPGGRTRPLPSPFRTAGEQSLTCWARPGAAEAVVSRRRSTTRRTSSDRPATRRRDSKESRGLDDMSPPVYQVHVAGIGRWRGPGSSGRRRRRHDTWRGLCGARLSPQACRSGRLAGQRSSRSCRSGRLTCPYGRSKLPFRRSGPAAAQWRSGAALPCSSVAQWQSIRLLTGGL